MSYCVYDVWKFLLPSDATDMAPAFRQTGRAFSVLGCGGLPRDPGVRVEGEAVLGPGRDAPHGHREAHASAKKYLLQLRVSM